MGYLTILHYVTFIVALVCALIFFIRGLLRLYEENPFATLVFVFIVVAMFLASWVIYLDYPDLLVPLDNVLRKGN